jgi:hypothetical protein
MKNLFLCLSVLIFLAGGFVIEAAPRKSVTGSVYQTAGKYTVLSSTTRTITGPVTVNLTFTASNGITITTLTANEIVYFFLGGLGPASGFYYDIGNTMTGWTEPFGFFMPASPTAPILIDGCAPGTVLFLSPTASAETFTAKIIIGTMQR